MRDGEVVVTAPEGLPQRVRRVGLDLLKTVTKDGNTTPARGNINTSGLERAISCKIPES